MSYGRRMRVAVVGGGAWGMPAATELARRGHEVVLHEQHGVGNPWGSSPGPTRIWRLTHEDRLRVRLAQRAVAAWRAVEARSGRSVLVQRGLLWRDETTHADVVASLAAEGVPYVEVEPADVARYFPGLVPDARPAVWQETAGPVLAEVGLRAHRELFDADGGTTVTATVRAVETDGGAVRVVRDDGSERYDRVVVAAGPWTPALLEPLGVSLTLRPHLEQVVHVGDRSAPTRYDDLPCLLDGWAWQGTGLYAMPTPGIGYKAGLDHPLRDFTVGDLDRTPDAVLTDRIRDQLVELVPDITGDVIDAQVCVWTDSPDQRFVIDRVADGRVVVACGDSGQGFKFSALMGPVLADLVEGRDPDEDIATFGLARFAPAPA